MPYFNPCYTNCIVITTAAYRGTHFNNVFFIGNINVVMVLGLAVILVENYHL